MSKRKVSTWLLPAFAGWTVLLGGCGDDAVGAGGGGTAGSTGGSGGNVSVSESSPATISESATASGGADSTGADTEPATGTGDTDAGDTDSGTDSGSETGEDVEPGQTASGFVNAGTVTSSPGYRLIWTFGQETQNQNTMDSAAYTLRGGLIQASQ